jgi:hypothetical protein
VKIIVLKGNSANEAEIVREIKQLLELHTIIITKITEELTVYSLAK